MPLKTERYIAGVGTTPAQSSLPFPKTKTGTITTSGTVVIGIGTKFTEELVEGDYIYNTTDNSLRKIIGIQNDLILRIDTAFTTNISGGALLISRAKYLSVACTTTGSATKDGVTIASGQFLSLNSNGGVVPFTYSGAITFDVTHNI